MSAMEPLRVVQLGLGPIGLLTASILAERPSVALVAAVDHDPSLVGRPLPTAPALEVVPSLAHVIERGAVDVVVVTTGSRLPQVRAQIDEAVGVGAHVVSSCEELLYPWLHYPEEAASLERHALEQGVAIVGAGVNPGFVLDALPAFLTGACGRVRRVRGLRVVDVLSRRSSLRKKVGCGLPVDDFAAGVAQGRYGHVGLVESAALIAHGLGWSDFEVEESVLPRVATAPESMKTGVGVGRVIGVVQSAVASVEGHERVRLECSIYAGAADPRDEIIIEGEPGFSAVIKGGIRGDEATAAVLANVVSLVGKGGAGLLTLLDLPLLRCASAGGRSARGSDT